MERRLAAILATDVVGYSRLMEEDEEWTHATLKERRKALFEPTIRQARGHIVKLTGDGALIEFPSTLAAVQCAIQIQRLNKRENETLPERKIHFRIGISIGDVMFDEGDIYGTGVNIAARLQAIAASDGICISGAAREQVRGRTDVSFTLRGQEQLRNIPEPILVYEVDPGLTEKTDEPMLLPAPPSVPAQPSLAILPFENLGSDGQQYFSDGITRDLITELSRFRSLFVISANSSFRYRGRAKEVSRIGRELGVRYLGDGSVQRIGNQLRVTAELVDAETGRRVWGDRYSHDVDDPTAVQDWLAHNIASRLHNRLEQAERDIGKRKPPAALKAYDLWLEGVEHHESSSADGYAKAHELYLRAIEVDPTFARVYASLAELIFMESVISNWGQETTDEYAEVAKYARMALALDDQDANGHAVMGWVHMMHHEFAKAARHWEMANSLNPNDADIMMWRATAMAFLGEVDKGVEAAQLAMRLNPLHPDWYQSDYAVVLFFARRFEEMQAIYDIVPELFPHTPAWRAAAYAHLDRMQEAADKAAAFCRNIAAIWKGEPNATPADYGRWLVRIIPIRRREEQEIMQTGLRLAGLLD
jgi:TolB-like protein/class 3 adenylate cyclase